MTTGKLTLLEASTPEFKLPASWAWAFRASSRGTTGTFLVKVAAYIDYSLIEKRKLNPHQLYNKISVITFSEPDSVATFFLAFDMYGI